MDQPRFNEKEIIAIFRQAAQTLRRLPSPKVQGYFNSWPDIIYTKKEVIRMDQKPSKQPVTPEAISRMEKAISWLSLLEKPIDRKIVWMRANYIPWEIISKTFAFSRVTASKKYKNAIKFITQNYP